MKGIILAGGHGTRLAPATRTTNKHLVPILNRPMVLYPIDTLKALGVTDIMIVSGGTHLGSFADFLGDGSEFGVSLTYRVQGEARGIADALTKAKDFVADATRVAVILGDNVFENTQLTQMKEELAHGDTSRAHIFVKDIAHPERFGVLTPSSGGMRIIEKPADPQSKKAVAGLYIYPADVFTIAGRLSPSARGELEITDVNNAYLEAGKCDVTELTGFWSDAGTPESLFETISWAFSTRS